MGNSAICDFTKVMKQLFPDFLNPVWYYEQDTVESSSNDEYKNSEAGKNAKLHSREASTKSSQLDGHGLDKREITKPYKRVIIKA